MSIAPALAQAVAASHRAITVTLLGDPVPFARTRHGKAGTLFTPGKQRNAAAAFRIAAQQAMLHGGHTMLDEPLRLDFTAEVAIPRSWSKRRQAAALAGDVRPTGKPDLDNLVKLATDAMNSTVFRDDALIVEVSARKVYGPQPRITAIITPLGAG